MSTMTAEPSTAKSASSEGIKTLFEFFEVLYGARLADMWRGIDPKRVRDTWAAALGGFKRPEIKLGMEACRAKPFPPTLPEFLLLCRPPVDFEAAFEEAQKQLTLRERGEDSWSSPVVYWTAVEFGSFNLRTETWKSAKAKWTRIYVMKLNASLPPIPQAERQLPSPGKTVTSMETGRARLAELKANLGRKAA